MQRREVLRVAGTVGVGSTLVGCLGGEDTDTDGLPEEVSIGFPSPVPGEYYLSVYPAFQDILSDEGSEIDRTVFDGYTPLTGAMVRGDIDLAYLSPDALIRATNEGLPVVGIKEFTQKNMFAMMVSPEIEEWSDLEGARIATHSPDSPTTLAANIMIEEELGDTDALDWQYILGSENRAVALQEGEIDATTAYLIDCYQAEADGYAHTLGYPWDYEPLDNETTFVWIALEPDLDDNEELLDEYTSLLMDANETVYDTAVDDLHSGAVDTGIYPPYDDEVWQQTIESAQDAEIWSRDGFSEERFENAQDNLIETGILEEENRADTEQILDDRFFA